jgi:phosphate:Na+ symporter
MGANIGTTLTAWLISLFGFKFKIVAFALPVIAVGFPLLFSSRTRMNSIGEVFIGFALLFMGLDALKNAVPDLEGNTTVLEFLANFTSLGIFSTLIFVGIGTLLTIVLQSSSAAMALTLTLVFKGIIPYDVAAAIVLGENIGTTITANLAALVANVHAKRAARAHFMFNVAGVIWMLFVFPFFLKFVDVLWGSISDLIFTINPDAGLSDELISELDAQDRDKYQENTLKLSLFHTSFNLINVALLFGLVNQIAKAVIRLTPSKGDDEDFSLEFIGRGLVKTPDISLAEAENEIAKFAKINQKGVQKISDLIEETEYRAQQKLIKKIKEYEDHTDLIEVKVGEFLMELSRLELSDDGSRRVQSLLAVINHMETIGDIYYQMSRSIQQKIEKKIWFDESHRNDLREMRDLVFKSMEVMKPALKKKPDQINLETAIELEKEINKKRDKFKARIFKRIEKGKTNLETGLIYMDLVSGYEKIADHVVHISEALRGDHLDLEDEVTT